MSAIRLGSGKRTPLSRALEASILAKAGTGMSLEQVNEKLAAARLELDTCRARRDRQGARAAVSMIRIWNETLKLISRRAGEDSQERTAAIERDRHTSLLLVAVNKSRWATVATLLTAWDDPEARELSGRAYQMAAGSDLSPSILRNDVLDFLGEQLR